MGLLDKIFGGGDPLAPVRRASRNKAWADVLARGESISAGALDQAAREELTRLLSDAGDALAAVNLFEAEACLRGGNAERAAEHLCLAAGQARNNDLAERIRFLQQEMKGSAGTFPEPQDLPPEKLPQPSASCCPSGCSSVTCGPSPEGEEIDDATRMELILTSYPSEWIPRYESLRRELREAVMMAHEGLENEAREAFESVSEADRDDLYHFEHGALLARLGNAGGARKELEKALSINPVHLLAQETLIDVELGNGETAAAEKRLRGLLGQGVALSFCHVRLAGIEAGRGRLDAAVEHGRQALAHGDDPQALLLTASLLERTGKPHEAEMLLARYPAGGCGGHNIPLAEFWARHGKNPDKALAGLQAALRQEPENPLWLIRIAQVYLSRGRRDEADALLRKVTESSPDNSENAREARLLLETCRSAPSP